MAEETTRHNAQLQNRIVAAEIEDVRSGRRYGFAALGLLVAAGLFAAYLGFQILAVALVGTGTVGVVVSFIRRVRRKDDEEEEPPKHKKRPGGR